MIIRTLHGITSPEKLAAVKEIMQKKGTPTIKAIDVGDGFYLACEGTHRLVAAKELGLTPKITNRGVLDTDFNSECANAGTIKELVDYIISHYDGTEIDLYFD